MNASRIESRNMTQTNAFGFSSASRLQGRSIGVILVESGRLSPENAERILQLQKEKGLRFGDAAMQLGLLSQLDIDLALSDQFDFPYLQAGKSNVSEEVVAAYKPFDRQIEKLRSLRSQLMLRWFEDKQNQPTLCIAGTQRGEGRSVLAANLAVIFSQLGEKTLLIDADMRNPRQHALFGISNSHGLAAALTGRANEPLHAIAGLPGLHILPAGSSINAQELLGRPAFAQLLAEFSAVFDVILIDTPASSEYADISTIAARTGAALVVVRQNHSLAAEVKELGNVLNQGSVNVVGTVLNNY